MVDRCSVMNPSACASRAVIGFSPTSTILARPLESRCVSFDLVMAQLGNLLALCKQWLDVIQVHHCRRVAFGVSGVRVTLQEEAIDTSSRDRGAGEQGG